VCLYNIYLSLDVQTCLLIFLISVEGWEGERFLFHTQALRERRQGNKSLKGKVVIRKSRSMLFMRKKDMELLEEKKFADHEFF